jgi:hypothetical protein
MRTARQHEGETIEEGGETYCASCLRPWDEEGCTPAVVHTTWTVTACCHQEPTPIATMSGYIGPELYCPGCWARVGD